MKSEKQKQGLGVFYSRDSGGRHQNTPPQYINWAKDRANELGVTFRGKPDDIRQLMKSRTPCDANIFFDYEVEGDRVSRPALDALFDRLENSKGRITHVFIPDPDRLMRPDGIQEGIELEDRIRRFGVSIVYKTKTIAPSNRGKRQDFGEFIGRAYDFHRSGEFLDHHAEKMVSAKTESAEKGQWAGGRAPFGFRRWLVEESGAKVRRLDDGEIVRKDGHHVELFPDDGELQIALRIREMLSKVSASEVCRILDDECIPSPDAGRLKKMNGGKRKVSGKWNVSTVNAIARNELFVGSLVYGKRAMGKKRRMTPNGPRELNEDEFLPNGRPRVVQNPRSIHIRCKASFNPLVDQKDHDKLLEELDRRGASLRGKRKCQNPKNNPLGGHITDMACGWPMYKTNCKKNNQDTFKYRCGCYDKSKGDLCEHNCVDGPAAIAFVLKSIQQRIIQPGVWTKLESRIRAIAEKDRSLDLHQAEKSRLASEIAELQNNLEQASTNMALAKQPEHFAAVAKVFDSLNTKKASLEGELEKLTQESAQRPTVDDEIRLALANAENLWQMDFDDADDSAMAREVIEATNAQMFARFRKERCGKRELNRIVGGVITFGTAPPPIIKYTGPTDREHLRSLARKDQPASTRTFEQCATAKSPVIDLTGSSSINISTSKAEAAIRKTAEADDSDSAALLVTSGETGSLGSNSRGDKTAIELFIAGIQGWEAGLRRRMDNGKSKQD